MPHEHSHSHGHSHGVSAETRTGMLALALAINLAFMVVEVVVGVIANSLALISDAGHMLTDAGAIALALVTARLARRAASGSMTFGLKRAEILSAQFNGVTLILLAAYVTYEGIRRLSDPPEVGASLMLWVGIAGLLVNLAAAWALAKANRSSLNVEGAFQHNLYDAYSSVATAIAAGVILATGFDRADAIASLVIALPMFRSGWLLVKASGRVMMEAAPEGVNPDDVGRAMTAADGVIEVHDLHIWEVTSGFPALSAHVLVGRHSDCHQARRRLERLLHDRYGIDHTTLQVDHEGGDLIALEVPDSRPPFR